MLNNKIDHTKNVRLNRRDFLLLSSMAVAGYLFGCATDPVTGKKQFMLVSEDTEIQIDKQYAPLQFSTDYGEVQDSQLNRYVSQVGNKMAAASHRPQMPYSFRVVNATYVNAYAFPGLTLSARSGRLDPGPPSGVQTVAAMLQSGRSTVKSLTFISRSRYRNLDSTLA